MRHHPGCPTPLWFDIFCQVVDNFGDIGVCWRLARQLAAAPHRHHVRLWVDDLHTFQRLEPGVNAQQRLQQLDGVQILHWTTDTPARYFAGSGARADANSVVIEAFGCDLPPAVLNAMPERNCLWLNLEYLSAEDWVEGFHLQPSLQPGGLRKHFFFPGFTVKTGGLLREPGLLEKRNAWQANPAARRALLAQCGLNTTDIDTIDNGARLVLVFCYPDAPLSALAQALAANSRPTVLLLPDGVWPGVEDTIDAGIGRLQIRRIPFLRQDDFDRLLWSCDLNIVRGEDSWVRAHWAGRPMIWQPYTQAENAHWVKLDAWLARTPLHADTRKLIRHWTAGDETGFSLGLAHHLQADIWTRWEQQSAAWCHALAAQPDLASNLLTFCAGFPVATANRLK